VGYFAIRRLYGPTERFLNPDLAPAMAQSAAAKAVLGACKPDITHFCSQVPPGQGRIKACMKEHLPELSSPARKRSSKLGCGSEVARRAGRCCSGFMTITSAGARCLRT
jgi:hypothetical protein